jgi:hypothetical protein
MIRARRAATRRTSPAAVRKREYAFLARQVLYGGDIDVWDDLARFPGMYWRSIAGLEK